MGRKARRKLRADGQEPNRRPIRRVEVAQAKSQQRLRQFQRPSGMPVEVNSAAVQRSNVQLPGEISRASAREKSAEIIVVEETSRSADKHSKVAGETHPMKDRTNEEGIDPATDKRTDNASVRGELESRDGGKHGAPQERIMIEEILEPENVEG